MNDDVLEKLATLLHRRNEVEVAIAEMTSRPMTVGHLGEWIASQIFDIRLEPSAAAPAIDGRFCTGALTGKTVNIKWYLKREGILDMSVTESPDYYLVLAGPPSPAVSSMGGTRPWQIDAVYLFDARCLRTELMRRGVKIGTATSIQNSMWEAAEIYPAASNNDLPITQTQASQLRLLCRSAGDVLEELYERRFLIRRLAALNRIDSVAVFGSVARREATVDSDVDLLVEPRKEASLFDLAQFEEVMELLLRRPVDVVSRRALDPAGDHMILSEAIEL